MSASQAGQAYICWCEDASPYPPLDLSLVLNSLQTSKQRYEKSLKPRRRPTVMPAKS